MWVHDVCDPEAARVMAALAQHPEQEIEFACAPCRGTSNLERQQPFEVSIQSALPQLWDAGSEPVAKQRLLDNEGNVRQPRSAWIIFSSRFDRLLNLIGVRVHTTERERRKAAEWRQASEDARSAFETLAREEQREYTRLIADVERSDAGLDHNDSLYRSSGPRRNRTQDEHRAGMGSRKSNAAPWENNDASESDEENPSHLSERRMTRANGRRVTSQRARKHHERRQTELPIEDEALTEKSSLTEHDFRRQKRQKTETKGERATSLLGDDACAAETELMSDCTSADLVESLQLLQKQGEIPTSVSVACQKKRGTYWPSHAVIKCKCDSCNDSSDVLDIVSFATHAGASQQDDPASLIFVEDDYSVKKQWTSLSNWLSRIAREDPKAVCKQGTNVRENPQLAPSTTKTHIRPVNEHKTLDLIEVHWQIDRCAVCDSDIDDASNQLLMCTGCKVVIHQHCYGVHNVPSGDALWLCRACECKKATGQEPRCAICPIRGGALKPMDDGGMWCHLTCYQWIPGLKLSDLHALEPISGLNDVDRDRFRLLCTVCRQRVGAKLQCDSRGCCLAYHPLCARAAGFSMQIIDDGPDRAVRAVSFCHLHENVNKQRFLRFGGKLGPLARPNADSSVDSVSNANLLKRKDRETHHSDKNEQQGEDCAVLSEHRSRNSRRFPQIDSFPESQTAPKTANHETEKSGCSRTRKHYRQGHPSTVASIGSERLRLNRSDRNGAQASTTDSEGRRQDDLNAVADEINGRARTQKLFESPMKSASNSMQSTPPFEFDDTAAYRPSQTVQVQCAGVMGKFYLQTWRIECYCENCAYFSPFRRLKAPKVFQEHAGANANNAKAVTVADTYYGIDSGTTLDCFVEQMQLFHPPPRICDGGTFSFCSLIGESSLPDHSPLDTLIRTFFFLVFGSQTPSQAILCQLTLQKR